MYVKQIFATTLTVGVATVMFLAIVLIGTAVGAIVIYFAWNWVGAEIFSAHTISFVKAMIIAFVVNLVLKLFR